jgi:hypothetical protein
LFHFSDSAITAINIDSNNKESETPLTNKQHVEMADTDSRFYVVGPDGVEVWDALAATRLESYATGSVPASIQNAIQEHAANRLAQLGE